MSEEELRIGNFVDFNGEIQPLTKKLMVFILEGGEKQFKSIPLTRAIFKDYMKCWEMYYFNTLKEKIMFFNINDKMDFRFYIDTNKIAVNNYELSHIKYLHQLQNLYFALTGEDLKIG